MPDETIKRYESLCDYARQTNVLVTIDAALGWDERTQMPSAGAEYRAEQSTVMAGLIHQRWTDAEFGRQLEDLSQATLSDDAAVVVRRLKRQRDKKVCLPRALVEELARTAVLGEHTWQKAREDNDFAAFRPVLEKMIRLKREAAEAIGYAECPYDALLDEYEPEESTARVSAVLAGLRDQLVPLVSEILSSGKHPKTDMLHRQFPEDEQDRLGREAATAIGFDFARGRLDVTVHPFCTTLGPHDCRITTRYDERFLNSALFGVLHEAGHGIYEQGLPPEQFGLPLGEAVSLGIHESQSRLWENLVARSRSFWQFLYPVARQYFPGALGDVTAEDLYRAVNEVRPSLIRVEADEVTYNLHILVRFELERDLLDDRLQVADLPEAWNGKYRDYLGITPPTDRDGVLQDVHWSSGLIGYFPTYSLGNLYAAQFFAQARADLGNLDQQFANGDFQPLREWLREKIHKHGQRWSAADLVKRVTGQPLSPKPLMDHLRAKMSPIYSL